MTHVAHDLDPPGGPRLGLIVLQADETIENEFRRLMPRAASLQVSRVPSGLEVQPHTLRAMEAQLPEAAGLLPRGVAFDVIGYACTSGAAELGSSRVAEVVRAGAPAREVTDPLEALLAACRRLGVARVALLSPYVAEVSEKLRGALAAAGVETTAFASFDVAEEALAARISPASIAAAAQTLGAARDVDAVFVSCTNLRAIDLIEMLDRDIGKPVLTSNQVLAWRMLAHCGAVGEGPLFGALATA